MKADAASSPLIWAHLEDGFESFFSFKELNLSSIMCLWSGTRSNYLQMSEKNRSRAQREEEPQLDLGQVLPNGLRTKPWPSRVITAIPQSTLRLCLTEVRRSVFLSLRLGGALILMRFGWVLLLYPDPFTSVSELLRRWMFDWLMQPVGISQVMQKRCQTNKQTKIDLFWDVVMGRIILNRFSIQKLL